MIPKVFLASYEVVGEPKRAVPFVAEVTLTLRIDNRRVEVAPVYVIWTDDFAKIEDRIVEIANLGEFWLIFPHKFQGEVEAALSAKLGKDKSFVIEDGNVRVDVVDANLLRKLTVAMLRVLKAYFGDAARIVDIYLGSV